MPDTQTQAFTHTETHTHTGIHRHTHRHIHRYTDIHRHTGVHTGIHTHTYTQRGIQEAGKQAEVRQMLSLLPVKQPALSALSTGFLLAKRDVPQLLWHISWGFRTGQVGGTIL